MIVRTTRKDGIGNQLLSIRDFLVEIDSHIGREKFVEVDFRHYKYSPPLLSVFFAAFLDGNSVCKAVNVNTCEYLGFQKFPEGIRPNEIIDWKKEIEPYKNKTYLPLICYSSLKDDMNTQIRNNVISQIVSMISDITGMPINYLIAINYLLTEISENVVEHANTRNGWVSFQYYKKKEYLDLCIADSGIGLLQSYKKYKGKKDYSYIRTDLDAIQNVIKGESTKNEGLNERGYGVHTSHKMIINGLNGNFVMLSGRGLMKDNTLIDFQCNFKGTLVMFRIPCRNYNDKFTYSFFVE